jgi:hypothetical protein
MRRHSFPPFDVSPRRWRALLLLALILMLISVDQAALESLVVAARDTLLLPSGGLVVAFRAIGLGFGLALPVGAIFAHLAGPRQVLLWSALGCAGATAFMGFAFNLGVATLFYLWFGVAAGMIPAAAVVALAGWFPMQVRGMAVGLVLGAGGSAAACLWLVLVHFDVRALSIFSFLGLGCLGLAWVGAWLRWYRLPFPAVAPVPGDRPAGIDTAWEEQRASDLPTGEVSFIPLIRQGLPLFGLAFVLSYALELCRDWLPGALLALRHQDVIGNGGLLAALGAGAPALGCFLGGVLTDRCVAHSHNVISARQAVIAGGLVLGLASFVPLMLSTGTDTIVLWQAVALCCFGLAVTPLWCGPLDIMPDAPGPLLAFLALGMGVGTLCSPVAVAEGTGHWMLGLYVGIPLIMAGTIGVFFVGPRRPGSVEADSLAEEESSAEAVQRLAAGPASFSVARPPKTDDEELLESLRDQGFMKATTRPV